MSAFINLVCSGDVVKIKEYLEDPLNEIEDRQIFINERDKSGKNALDFAGMLGREDVIRVLMECGADPNSSAERGLLSKVWFGIVKANVLYNCVGIGYVGIKV